MGVLCISGGGILNWLVKGEQEVIFRGEETTDPTGVLTESLTCLAGSDICGRIGDVSKEDLLLSPVFKMASIVKEAVFFGEGKGKFRTFSSGSSA